MIMPGIIASSGGLATSFESIATVTVGAGGSSTLDFSSIASTYQHLQIRGIARSNRATYANDGIKITFNGSTTGNLYSDHSLWGDGATALALSDTSANYIYTVSTLSSSAGSNGAFAGFVLDVLDYASTSKYKTIRVIGGYDLNGTIAGYGGYAGISSGLWQSTNAISSISFAPNFGTSFNQYTTVALYGVKA
jgi:hypothetical protein